jgi:hypothetical protein
LIASECDIVKGWFSLRVLDSTFHCMSHTTFLLLFNPCYFSYDVGFKCTGGVFDLFSSGRRLDEKVHELFGHQDASGLLLSPLDTMDEDRDLLTCKTDAFAKPDCVGDCTGCSSTEKAKCLARKTTCKAGSIDGLSLPFLSDLMSVVGLISGGDIVSVDIDDS